jgi:hypothetical protein
VTAAVVSLILKVGTNDQHVQSGVIKEGEGSYIGEGHKVEKWLATTSGLIRIFIQRDNGPQARYVPEFLPKIRSPLTPIITKGRLCIPLSTIAMGVDNLCGLISTLLMSHIPHIAD